MIGLDLAAMDLRKITILHRRQGHLVCTRHTKSDKNVNLLGLDPFSYLLGALDTKFQVLQSGFFEVQNDKRVACMGRKGQL